MIRRFLALLTIAFPAAAASQERCTDPTAGASYRQTPLTVAVTAPTGGERDLDRYTTTLLAAFGRGYFDPGRPASTTSGAIVMTGIVADTAQRDPLHATVELLIDRNGHPLDARLIARSTRPALDTALLRAATAAGGPAGYGKVPRKVKGDTLHFTLQIDDRSAPAGAVSFGAYSIPYLIADRPPTIRVMPPARAPRGHHGKQVILAGTVSSLGRVIPSTIRVVSSSDSVLVPIARQSFEHTTFRPGTLHGCPAEATIRQLFNFR